MSQLSQPLVSIIVTVYNLAPYLGDALNSIQSQSHRNLEIIVVDDCSTDGSTRLIAERAARDSRVKHLQQPVNGGALKAKHRGLAEATGGYFLLVDGDDWIDSDLVRTCLAAIGEDDCLVFGFDMVDHETRVAEQQLPCRTAAQAIERGLPLTAHQLSSVSHITPICFYAARFRPAFAALYAEYPALPYFEDLPSYWLTMTTLRVRHLPNVLYHYRINRPGQSTDGWWARRRREKEEALKFAVEHALVRCGTSRAAATELIFYKLLRVTYSETLGLVRYAPSQLGRFQRALRPVFRQMRPPAVTKENWQLMLFFQAFMRVPAKAWTAGRGLFPLLLKARATLLKVNR